MRFDVFERRPRSLNRLPFVFVGCANGLSGGFERAKLILCDGAMEDCSDGGAIDADDSSDDKFLETSLVAF